MKHECSIVKDLLPLYQEEMTTQESKEYIESHLEGCEDCRKEWEQMHKKDAVPADAAAPLKSLKKKLLRKKIWTIVITVAAIAAAFFLMQWRWFLPCTEDNIRVVENRDGSVTVYMEPVRSWRSQPYRGNWFDADGNPLEGTVYEIKAYTTVWDHIMSKLFYTRMTNVGSTTISPEYVGQEITIFYNQDGRGDYVLIYGDEDLMEYSAYKKGTATEVIYLPADTATNTN